MSTLFTIAIRNVMRNRRRTLMTLAALVVGVSVLISIRGLMNGLQHALIHSITQAQTGAFQVHRTGYLTNVLSSPLGLHMPDSILEEVAQVQGVRATAGRIAFAGMINHDDETLFTTVQAFDPNAELAVCPLRTTLLEGQSAFVGGGGHPEDGILLTSALARSINLPLGGQAAFLASDVDGALSAENAQLVGTIFLAMPGEKKVALAPLALAQKLLKLDRRVTEVVASVDDLEAVNSIAQAVQKKLGSDYEVHTWEALAAFVRQAMARQNFVVSVIALSFMLLMLLGVANTMLMSMLERTREIGTMMALGVRQGSILVLFLWEALIMGALGGALGSAFGCAIVTYWGHTGITVMAPGSHVPFTILPTITWPYITMVLGMASVGSAFFALYPAWRASRMRPVQALAGQ